VSVFPPLPDGFKHFGVKYDRFKDLHPQYQRNTFVMMPFSAPGSNEVYAALSTALHDHGLVPIRDDETATSPALWQNIQVSLLGSAYGVAVFMPDKHVQFNPNVAIESGFMMALDRPVLLLVSNSLQGVPADFSGLLYRTFNPYQLAETLTPAVGQWVERDVSYFDYRGQPLVVFVSRGGTCRCAMAKGLLLHKLQQLKITGVAVDAAAVAEPVHAQISPSVRTVLAEVGAAHHLDNHYPRKMCKYLQDRADLIIRLTDVPLTRPVLAPSKVIDDIDLFGERVLNPYPDDQSSAAVGRYRASRDTLSASLDSALPEILNRLGVDA
jgi:protein-tyrosine-phosphatase